MTQVLSMIRAQCSSATALRRSVIGSVYLAAAGLMARGAAGRPRRLQPRAFFSAFSALVSPPAPTKRAERRARAFESSELHAARDQRPGLEVVGAQATVVSVLLGKRTK